MGHYILAPIENGDWDEVVELRFRAFSKELFCQLTRGPNTSQNRAQCRAQYVDQRQSQPDIIWLKAVDADDPSKKILGFARYKIMTTYMPPAPVTFDPSAFDWLEDEDREIAVSLLHDVVDRKTRFIREAHIDCRGRGIGSRLLQWGAELADHMMLPLWLESSTMAHGLYLRHGFFDKIHCRLVMGKWDIEYFIMKRNPRAMHIDTEAFNGRSKPNGN
ncbi:predicted protein [Uncinocarpus reesii 1704]|uniref:N-acetyltransferase domain-containing protein n=1 Tax=Uncinocarpus reesii (strain UAMH 1704) TaxID=336963 RepID=C4JY97_UNCRE|nr:uncharacterized protein UREG_07148 [Uncinocarpus reesii 1704]EEP82283.1 predicted protein [Uncinocarpus reesii 1704]